VSHLWTPWKRRQLQAGFRERHPHPGLFALPPTAEMTDPEAAFWRIVAANYTHNEIIALRALYAAPKEWLTRYYGYKLRRF
jgi:hypothetical protein